MQTVGPPAFGQSLYNGSADYLVLTMCVLQVACLQVQGDEALKKGNYQEAVHSYSQGLMLDPKNCELLSCRAVAFIQMKWYEDARVDGEALIQIQPEFPQVKSVGKTLGQKNICFSHYLGFRGSVYLSLFNSTRILLYLEQASFT